MLSQIGFLQMALLSILHLEEKLRQKIAYQVFSSHLKTYRQRGEYIFSTCCGGSRANASFTAAYGAGPAPHEIRRVSSKEYYSMTGSGRRNFLLQQQKHQMGIDQIECQIPTPKTSHIQQYHRYISYILRYYEELAGFYDMGTAERRFQNYQGVQRARDEMANVFVTGGKKYNPSRRKKLRKNRKRRKKKEIEETARVSMVYSTMLLGPGNKKN